MGVKQQSEAVTNGYYTNKQRVENYVDIPLENRC
jgi:hypothetical protein